MTVRPYTDAAFLRTLNIRPYDPEEDAARERQREHEACAAYAAYLERKRRNESLKQFVFAVTFAVCALAVAWVWSLV